MCVVGREAGTRGLCPSFSNTDLSLGVHLPFCQIRTATPAVSPTLREALSQKGFCEFKKAEQSPAGPTPASRLHGDKWKSRCRPVPCHLQGRGQPILTSLLFCLSRHARNLTQATDASTGKHTPPLGAIPASGMVGGPQGLKVLTCSFPLSYHRSPFPAS